jgi:hypothetical protein
MDSNSLKNTAQNRSNGDSTERDSFNPSSIPIAPIVATDSLGYLASQFSNNQLKKPTLKPEPLNFASSSASRPPVTLMRSPTSASPYQAHFEVKALSPVAHQSIYKERKKLVRRSKSFNALASSSDYFNYKNASSLSKLHPISPSPLDKETTTPAQLLLQSRMEAATLQRSKSHRVDKSSPAAIPESSTPTKPTFSSKMNESVVTSPIKEKTLTPKRSMRWMNRLLSPSTDSFQTNPNSQNSNSDEQLNNKHVRSKTNAVAPRTPTGSPTTLSRSATTAKKSNNEKGDILKSFKNLFDNFSLSRSKSSASSFKVQMDLSVDKEGSQNNSPQKVVIQNEPLKMKPLIIQQSGENTPVRGEYPSVTTPHVTMDQSTKADYFSSTIKGKSNLRPIITSKPSMQSDRQRSPVPTESPPMSPYKFRNGDVLDDRSLASVITEHTSLPKEPISTTATHIIDLDKAQIQKFAKPAVINIENVPQKTRDEANSELNRDDNDNSSSPLPYVPETSPIIMDMSFSPNQRKDLNQSEEQKLESELTLLERSLKSIKPLSNHAIKNSFIHPKVQRFSSASSILPSELRPDLDEHKLVYQGPANQILNSVMTKDRYLFLFDHILVVTKPLEAPEFSDLDSEFEIKKIIWVEAITSVINRGVKNSADFKPPPSPTSDPEPKKLHPIMASVIRRFEIDPFKALDYMVSRGALRSDPSSIAKFLFNTSELNRRQLGRFLGDIRNGNLARAFMDRFSWSNLSIDHSLRALFMSLRLPGEAQPADQILDHFSVAWHAANEEFINFDLELAQNLITVLMSLSAEIQTSESMPSLDSFISQVRAFDTKEKLAHSYLSQLFDSISDEPLELATDIPYHPITFGCSSDIKLIINELSEPMWIQIPKPDPQFRILLHGIGLTFHPPILDFTGSHTQTFRVTGTAVGRRHIMFIKLGHHSADYQFLPSKAFNIEHTFMKYTCQISFQSPPFPTPTQVAPYAKLTDRDHIIVPQHNSAPIIPNQAPIPNKKYMFSFPNPQILDEWTEMIENTIDLYQEALEEEDEDLTQEQYQLKCTKIFNHWAPSFRHPQTGQHIVRLASGNYF